MSVFGITKGERAFFPWGRACSCGTFRFSHWSRYVFVLGPGSRMTVTRPMASISFRAFVTDGPHTPASAAKAWRLGRQGRPEARLHHLGEREDAVGGVDVQQVLRGLVGHDVPSSGGHLPGGGERV